MNHWKLEVPINSRVEPFIKVNGEVTVEKEQGHKFGLMVQSMLENGKIIGPVEKEYFIMQMEMYLKVSGIRIKQMGKEFISILMDQDMKENGKMIISMDMVRKFGMMDLSIQGNIFKGINRELADMNGQMVLALMENGKIIK